MMRKTFLSLIALCGLFVMNANAQHGAKSAGVTAVPVKVLLSQLLNTPSLKNQEVTMVLVTLQPGEQAAAHIHPVPTFG